MRHPHLRTTQGYGLAMLMVFLATTVMIGASMQIMAAPVSLMYMGAASQNKMSAEQLAQAGMDVMVADLQSRYDSYQTIDTSYSFTSSSNADAVASVQMPNSPDALGGAASTVGSYTGSVVSVNGNTLLLKVTATVGNGSYSHYKLLTLSRSIFSASNITGATAAYGMRKLVSGYAGSAIRVRRADTNTETDIGFTPAGDLDYTALWSFLEGTNPATESLIKRPLDKVTGASAAFSLRKLDKDFTGSAIKVRRSSDNAERDIGFDPAGNLDIGALMDFVGAGSGYVTTMYDQSGNGRNATQTTTSKQPTIVSSGILKTQNGRPAIQYDWSDDIMNFTRPFSGDFAALGVYSANQGWDSGSGPDDYWHSHDGLLDMEVGSIVNDFGISVDSLGRVHAGMGDLAGATDYDSRLPTSVIDGKLHWFGLNRQQSSGIFTLHGDNASFSKKGGTNLVDADTTISIGARHTDDGMTHDGYSNEVIIYSSYLSSANLQTLQKDMAGYWNIPVARNVTRPLDTVGSATAAYGLRRLSTAYTGSLIRVRRSSDNAEQDIGQLLGDLDVASLLSFVGSGSGYVTTWYDQSGNGLNATQATTTSQPTIVSSGTLETINNCPAIKFAGHTLATASSATWPSGSGARTLNAVYKFSDTSGTYQTLVHWGTNSAATASRLYKSGPSLGFFGNVQSVYGALGIDTDTVHTLSATHDSGTVEVYLDGALSATGAVTLNTTANTPLQIGTYSGSFTYNGHLSEILVYSSALSKNNRAAIEKNQLQYYSPPSRKAYVTKWYDQSGNGNHLTQTNPLQQPVLSFGSDGAAKNIPTLYFNGTTNPSGAILDSATGFPTNADYSISTVFSYRDASLNNNIVSSTGTHALYMGGGNNLKIYHNGTFATSSASLATYSLYAVSATYTNSSKSGSVYVGGGQSASGTGTTANVNNYASIRIGAHGTGSTLNGTVSEAIVFNRVLTTDERQALYRQQTAYYGAK